MNEQRLNRLWRRVARVCALSACALTAPAAVAYVGPGAGLTMLGSLWGLIVAVVFVLVGLVLLPLRLLRNRARARRERELDTGDVTADDGHEPEESPGRIVD